MAVLVIVISGAACQEREEAQISGINAMMAVAPPERLVEGRLDRFPYRPLARVMRGRENEVADLRSIGSLYATIGRVADQAKREPSVANLHSLAVAYLMAGRPDHSVATFREALTKQTRETELARAIRASRDYSLLNDFSVAALAEAKADDAGRNVGAAVEATQQAWQLRKTPETAWNRAIALEKVGVADTALSSWRDYVSFDPSSRWAAEAKRYIRRLDAEIADAKPPAMSEIRRLIESGGHEGVARVATLWPSACQAYVDENLLPALAQAGGSGDLHTVRRYSNIAESLSDAIGKSRGDRSLASVATDLGHSLTRDPGSGSTRALLTAVATYVAARAKYRENDISAAKQGFRLASAALGPVHSPLSEWANFYLACCSYYDNAYPECLSRLSIGMDARLSAAGWTALLANRAWVRALALGVQNHRGESIAEFEKAQSLFGSIGERDSGAAIASLIAEAREYLGDLEAAARSRWLALALLPSVVDPARRERILNEAVEAAINQNLLRTGLVLQDKVVAEVAGRSRHVDAADAFLWRAMVWARLGDPLSARTDIERAERLLPSIQDAHVREKMVADIAFGKAAAGISNERSKEALDSAAAFYRRAENRVRLCEVYRLQALAAIHDGALDEGETLLRRSLREIRFGEQHLADPASKLIYIASASQIASVAAEEFIRRDSPDRAFALLEDIRNTRSLKPNVEGLGLPDGEVVVSYLIGDKTSYAWVVRGGTKLGVRLSTCRAAMQALTDVLSDRLPKDGLKNATVSAALNSLYDALISPVARLIDGAGLVIIVPDDAIGNVPFPALRNRTTGRYFVQDALLVESPGVAAFVHAEAQAKGALRLPFDHATLLISDPESNGVAPLPALSREIAVIRKVSHSASIVASLNRAPRGISDELRSATLLHFGGHVEFDAASPADSALVIGRSNDQAPTRLTVRELVTRVPSAKLVVLSACDSGRVGSLPSAGIAQWLVAVGVTSVIATTSAVDDAAAADVMSDYYSCLRVSANTASALRTAQLAAIRRGDEIGWPAFIYFGVPQTVEKED